MRETAAESGKPAAERKRDGEKRVDVDAESARHALVVHRGAHLRAEAGRIQASSTSTAVISAATAIRNSR